MMEDLIRREDALAILDLAEHDAEERDWRSGANEIARLIQRVRSIPASPEVADAETRGMERAVHVMPHYFAVYSVTGVHIGVWEDGQIAGEVLTEYAGGSIVEMVPISAIRAEAAAIRRATEGEKA